MNVKYTVVSLVVEDLAVGTGYASLGAGFHIVPLVLTTASPLVESRTLVPHYSYLVQAQTTLNYNYPSRALNPKLWTSSSRNFFGRLSIPDRLYHLHRLDVYFISFGFSFARTSIGVGIPLADTPTSHVTSHTGVDNIHSDSPLCSRELPVVGMLCITFNKQPITSNYHGCVRPSPIHIQPYLSVL